MDQKSSAKQVAERYLSWEDEVKKHARPHHSPIGVIGERVIVRQRPDEKFSRVIHLLQDTRERSYQGVIIAAGDQAAAQLWDRGVECGDWVWYGKHAGVWEEWQHYLRGDDSCDHEWDWINPDVKGTRAKWCCKCDAILVVEELIVMNAKDIFGSIDLQVRLERGEVSRYRSVDADGKPVYLIRRAGEEEYQRPMATSWDIEFQLKQPRKAA